jgi:acetyl-CoA carboxylase biotin carboxyl carrier protein
MIMALITHDDIIQILKVIAESDIDELHLETGDFKLMIKRDGQEESIQPLESGTKRIIRERNFEKASAPLPSPTTVQKPEPVYVNGEDGFIPIKAPMLGTFYRAPKPEAPPFVEVGQLVTEEDVVCIIEVMKLFNMVRAGVKGRVAKICAENAQLVEYKQVLFLLENIEEDKNL